MQRKPVIIAEFQNMLQLCLLGYFHVPLYLTVGGDRGIRKRRSKSSPYWANHTESSFPLLSLKIISHDSWKKGQILSTRQLKQKTRSCAFSANLHFNWNGKLVILNWFGMSRTHFQSFIPLFFFTVKRTIMLNLGSMSRYSN